MADQQRYLVTARKYRPALFQDVVSQQHVTDTLKNALQLDRLAHAYLFSGPRGVGKTTTARILAKAINCETPREERIDEAEPCCECDSCRAFEDGRSMNVFEMDAASNNKVEDVRELRETVRIPPQGNTKKVYILDEVHMLSKSAFNALLKTLEEPPPHALFIFATTEPHKVLPTILSRCQRFDFRRIPVPKIVRHLRAICEDEGIEADEESLMLLARKGDGALRDALSAFDQAVSMCGTTITYGDLTEALGVVDQDLFFQLTDHVASQSSAGVLKLVHHVVRSGYDLQEFLAGLAEHVRNLLVARSLGPSALEDVAEATQQRYADEAANFGESDLLRLLTIAGDAEEDVKNSTQPRLKMEMTLLKMVKMQRVADLQAVIQKIEKLEAMAESGDLAALDAAASGGRADAETNRPSDSTGSADGGTGTGGTGTGGTNGGSDGGSGRAQAATASTSEPATAYDVPESVRTANEGGAGGGDTSADAPATEAKAEAPAEAGPDVPTSAEAAPTPAAPAAPDDDPYIDADTDSGSSADADSGARPGPEASSSESEASGDSVSESTDPSDVASDDATSEDTAFQETAPDAPPFGGAPALDSGDDLFAKDDPSSESSTESNASDDDASSSGGAEAGGDADRGTDDSDPDDESGGAGWDLFGAPALTKKKKKKAPAPSSDDSGSGDASNASTASAASAVQGDGQAGDAPDVSGGAGAAASWLGQAEDVWDDFINAVMSDKIALGANLTDTTPIEASGDTLTVAVPRALHRDSLQSNEDVLLTHLCAVLDVEVATLRFVVKDTEETDAATSTGGSSPTVSPREQLETLRDKYDALETLFSQFGAEPVW